MQQLIDQVTQRTGIPEDKARTAVDTVVGYLKEHLPGPIASQLDGVPHDTSARCSRSSTSRSRSRCSAR